MLLYGKAITFPDPFCVGDRNFHFSGNEPICGEKAKLIALFLGSLMPAIMAFFVDEALQKICMVGKEDETSPLLLECVVYVFLMFIPVFWFFSDSFGTL